jgi:EXLDI family protein
MMPNKTIYVADADLPLFERAQELANGNLSAAIVTALRAYVEGESETPGGSDDEIIVKVGSGGTYHRQRFHGRLLGKQTIASPDQSQTTHYKVYQTAKGKYAVYAVTGPNWMRRDWHKWQDYSSEWWHTTHTLDVVDSLDALESVIPPLLFQVVTHTAGSADGIEDLDI